MTKSAVETPQTYARFATAMNISAAQSLWHMSIGAELAYIFGAVVSTWILYLLRSQIVLMFIYMMNRTRNLSR